MQRTLLFFSLLASASAGAQGKHVDSTAYYRREIYRMHREADSSLRASAPYQAALAGIRRKHGADFYTGFVLFSGRIHSDFSSFNQSIARSGFPPLNEMSWQGGLGISSRNSEWLYDFYFASMSGSSSKKDGATVTAVLANFLEFDLGYDVIPGKLFALYPYAGLSIRSSSLQYRSSDTYNPAYTDISNLVSSRAPVTISSTRIGYQAGAGLDVLLGENRRHTTNKVLFVKAGLNRPVWADRYSKGGNPFPSVKQGDWGLTFGIKFGNLR